MDLDAFMKLCRQQELLKSSKNECYEVAFTLFSIVHNDQSGPIELVLPYLNRLEELRNAKIVVSADKFLEARQRGRIPELPRGPSELADFLLYNKQCITWKRISKLCVICRDSALGGNATEAASSAFQASSQLSELRSICAGSSRHKLDTRVEQI
ncbi:hypothetical protein QFC20_003723 [Naganishia adeliensis]|uniref:Uncharacterized protein n=1 Tax=Naganishia adeliensis TaxID=92952 RepID=A0ACC2W8N3_9TREE|nr:hypothetical protein QFC20_003723 [Naganishia adeliensis]